MYEAPSATAAASRRRRNGGCTGQRSRLNIDNDILSAG